MKLTNLISLFWLLHFALFYQQTKLDLKYFALLDLQSWQVFLNRLLWIFVFASISVLIRDVNSVCFLESIGNRVMGLPLDSTICFVQFPLRIRVLGIKYSSNQVLRFGWRIWPMLGEGTVKKNCMARPKKENMSQMHDFCNFWCDLGWFGDVLEWFWSADSAES